MIDKLNIAMHARIIGQVEANARLAKRAWEDSSDGRFGAEYASRRGERAEKKADAIAELVKPYGIRVDWPGLYPRFSFNGRDYATVADAIEAAVREMPEHPPVAPPVDTRPARPVRSLSAFEETAACEMMDCRDGWDEPDSGEEGW